MVVRVLLGRHCCAVARDFWMVVTVLLGISIQLQELWMFVGVLLGIAMQQLEVSGWLLGCC